MKTCKTCGRPLISLKIGMRYVWIHPDTECTGLPDGVQLTVEHLEEPLIEKYNEMYGTPEDDIFGYLEKLNEEKDNNLKNKIKKFLKRNLKRLPFVTHRH